MNLKYIKNHINYFALNISPAQSWAPKWPYPLLQAHRGHWLPSGKQNSLESLAEAQRLNYKMAEFDVQLTRDGVPVLFHDFDLRNTLKKNVAVSEIKYSDLKQLMDVPTLTEVLMSSDRPEFLNIEIKSKHFDSPVIEEKIAEAIRKTKTRDTVLFSSFNHWSLIKMKLLLPEIPRALLVTSETHSWNWLYLNKMWLSPLVEPSLIHADEKILDLDTVQFLKRFDFKIGAWTVNDISRAKELISWGVESIISDSILPYEISP